MDSIRKEISENVPLNISMVGVDLDGTLLNNKREISDYSLETIRKVIENGITLLPVTGRPLSGVPAPLLNVRGLRYGVVSNGAVVYDFISNKPIYEKYMPSESVKTLITMGENKDIIIEAAINGYLYGSESEFKRLFEGCSDKDFVKSYLQVRVFTDELYDIACKQENQVEKINIYFGDRKLVKPYVRKIRTIQGVEITSFEKDRIEVNASGCNKGNGLMLLSRHLGIKQEELMVIGDSSNDITMFENSRISIAMGNASKEIKEVVDYITQTNDNDGAAKALERFILR